MADTVTVKSKFGQLGVIDKHELPDAISRGFSVANNEEILDHNNEQEYGSGVLNPLTALAESTASTASFGISRELENATGLTTPEAQAARAKYNPMSNLAGIPAGLYLDPFGAVGLLNKGAKAAVGATKLAKAAEGTTLAAKILAKPAAAGLGSAVEGAAFGLGQSVDEHALGDPDLNAEKVAANMGYGALIGGGLGAGIEGGANYFGKSTLEQATKASSYQADIANAAAQQEAHLAEAQAVGAPEALGGEQPFQQFPNGPKSLADVQASVKTNFPVVPQELPSGAALKDAVAGLPDLQFKPHNLQYESLTDQGLRDYYKTFLEGQSEESKALRDYEALQKSEAHQKLKSTIDEIAPGYKVNTDPVSAGESVVDAFTKQYEGEQKELRPLFKQFDKIAEQKSVSAFDSLLRLRDTFPSIGDYLNADKEGVFQLTKYRPEMPFSKNTWEAISDVVDAANKKHLSLSEFRNVRDAMGDRLTLNASKRDYAHIGAIRKGMMDEMQAHVEKLAPDLNVRETFKRWAQNEERRELIEKVLGGKLSEKAQLLRQVKPEDVLDRVFNNTLSVQAAKDVLGQDFNKVMADYLSNKMAKVTDHAKNGFSSNKFATFLKDKTPELRTALAENSDKLQRINHLTDYMRILPDSPSVNPSGTAKTLNILERLSFISRAVDPKNAIKDFAQKFADKAAATQQRFTIDEVLAGKDLGSAQKAAEQKYVAASRLAKVERMAQQASKNIVENAKAIFRTGVKTIKASGAAIGPKLMPASDKAAEQEKHKDMFAKILKLQSDPEHMVAELQKATASLYDHAPFISQGIQATTARATEFLATKIPQAGPRGALSAEPVLAKSEIKKFQRYFTALENPINVMAQLKDCSITPEAVEAVQVVFPKLYQEMSQALLGEATDVLAKKKAHKIPFKTKLALSMFLGEDMDQSLSSQSLMANQASLAQKAQAPQMGQPQARAPQSGLNKLDQSQAMLTPGQKSANRTA